jgi:hypothetical protein
MGRDWKNPHYDYYLQQWRRALVALAVLALVVIAVLAPRLLRRSPVQGAAAEASAAAQPLRSAPRPRQVPRQKGTEEPADDLLPAFPADAEPGLTMPAPLPMGSGGSDDFAARKALALSLYRQNKLTEALEQAQAALAWQRDDELLELRTKLKREIEVQRDYDQARTANFVVLFDGYEHEEMKRTVLDILKDAYAGIGKELDYFPAEPITVILYTGKNFSDVTQSPEWAGGMFGKVDGKIRLAVQGAEGQERALRRVLTHEYVHALLHALAPATPLWLHEGLAQFLSGDEAVSVAQLIPLGLLANGFPRQARPAYVAYMESLQAVQDLVDEYGMPRLRRLLDGLGAGEGMEAAFSAAFGQPFSRWAAEWRPVERGDAGAATLDGGEEDG